MTDAGPGDSELPSCGLGSVWTRRTSLACPAMADGALADLLDAYRDAPSLEEAERVLRALESSPDGDEIRVGDLYDNLAEVAAEEGDFERAVRTQRRALELGCEMPTLGREMLGWYLMKAGERDVGEAEFAALRSRARRRLRAADDSRQRSL